MTSIHRSPGLRRRAWAPRSAGAVPALGYPAAAMRARASGRVVHLLHIALRSTQLLAAGVRMPVDFTLAWWARRGREGATAHAAGRALVHACSRLGATFIKVGQIASTRADLLPPALVEELARLQDRVPPFPARTARAIVEDAFGRPLETLFSAFDDTPVAAASVAQVHRAVLRDDGREVAVKIRRPDILEKVRLDRSILLVTARVLERLVPTLRLVSLEEAVRQFCEAVEEQIHLSNEAANNRRFRANFADDPDVDFPVLVPELCDDAVLTMEFVHGVREQDLAARGIDVRRVVEAGMRCVSRMIFTHGFVHADLHPGNLRFLPPGRVILLDLGLVGRLEDAQRLTNAQLLYAFATGDGKTVARLFYDNAEHAATPSYDDYEREIVAFVEEVRVKGMHNVQFTLEIGRIFDILRRHRIQASSHMTMVNLALMTAEGLGKRLAPDLALADEALPYLAEALGLPAAGGAAPAAR